MTEDAKVYVESSFSAQELALMALLLAVECERHPYDRNDEFTQLCEKIMGLLAPLQPRTLDSLTLPLTQWEAQQIEGLVSSQCREVAERPYDGLQHANEFLKWQTLRNMLRAVLGDFEKGK